MTTRRAQSPSVTTGSARQSLSQEPPGSALTRGETRPAGPQDARRAVGAQGADATQSHTVSPIRARQLKEAYIALGANIGDPVATVGAAFDALAELEGVRLLRASSLYRTAPVGLEDQPDFINAVARVETSLAPHALLDTLLGLEARFGRIRHERNGPRSLDLDLLLYDGRTLDTPDLILPHPRLHLRAFVLVPLAEIAPDLAIPGRGTVAAWLPAVANQAIERL